MGSAWIAELAKGLTAGTQAYQSADQDRKARAKQDFEMGVTLLDPDMATSAFAEMQAPDPVSRWLGSAMGQKLPDTSKQGAAIRNYLTMKRKEQEAALLKAQMAGLDNPVRLGPGAPVVPPVAQSLPPTTDQPLPLGAKPSPVAPPETSAPPPAWTGMTVPEAFGEMPVEVTEALQDPALTDEDRMRLLRSNESDVDLLGRQQQTPFTPTMAAGAGDDLAQAPPPPPKNYVLPGVTVGNPMGLLEPGNIDLSSFGAIKSPKGNISTVDSFAFKDGDKYVLLPLAANGETIQKEEAVGNYFRDGKKNLGTFATPEAAEDYRVKLHEQQATAYGQPPQAPAPASPAPVAPPVAAPSTEPTLILPPQDVAIPVPGYEGVGEKPIDRQTALDIQRMERAKGYSEAEVTKDFSGMSLAAANKRIANLGRLSNSQPTEAVAPKWFDQEATDPKTKQTVIERVFYKEDPTRPTARVRLRTEDAATTMKDFVREVTDPKTKKRYKERVFYSSDPRKPIHRERVESIDETSKTPHEGWVVEKRNGKLVKVWKTTPVGTVSELADDERGTTDSEFRAQARFIVGIPPSNIDEDQVNEYNRNTAKAYQMLKSGKSEAEVRKALGKTVSALPLSPGALALAQELGLA